MLVAATPVVSWCFLGVLLSSPSSGVAPYVDGRGISSGAL